MRTGHQAVHGEVQTTRMLPALRMKVAQGV
jgi:hypothetical protein